MGKQLPLCPMCRRGGMATNHTRRRGGLKDRNRKCDYCGAEDRVFVRTVEEIVKIFPVVCAATQPGASRRKKRALQIKQPKETDRMLPVKIQPSKLSDADLDLLQGVAFNVYDRATDLAVFMIDVCQDEALRRLKGEPIQPVDFPSGLSSAALAKSLLAAQAFTVAAHSRPAREFVGEINTAIANAAAAQLA